jgi:tetratricopeptide (TPR) repeat protein
MGFFDSLYKKPENVLIKRSITRIEDKNLQDAEKILKKTIEFYPESANALYLMGILTIRKNRTIALDYFERALRIDQNFEQAWFCKSLVFNSRLEFKNALNCINKVLELNNYNYEAILIKKDLLFYLRKDEELKRFKKHQSDVKFNDPKRILGWVIITDKGKLLGDIGEITKKYIFARPGEVVDPKKYKSDKEDRLIFEKKDFLVIGDVLIFRLDKKYSPNARVKIKNDDDSGKVVVTTEGFLLGDVRNFTKNEIIIRPGEQIDIRKFQTAIKGKCIVLPIRGVRSIDDIMIYQLPELDPKLVYKNHDEQSYIDRYFKKDYPLHLRI